MLKFLKDKFNFLMGKKAILPQIAAIVSTNDNPQYDDVIELPKPIVLINIAADNRTRGDTKGRIGLGNAIGRKLGTTVVYADAETLHEKYPDMGNESYEAKLTRYLTDLGCTPDMILGFCCDDTLRKLGKNPHDVVQYTDYNESLSRTYLNENELVAHNLTQEDLEIAGQEFDKQYPDIKKPIITIFLADQNSSKVRSFSECLTDITKNYPEATIYICGGRRNEILTQRETEKELNRKLDEKGQRKNIDVISWEFSPTGYNPYKGLIARSDHFIVWGCSQSLASEPLFAGKTVYLMDNDLPNLVKKGLAAQFNDCNRNEPFQTAHFPPVNLTEDLAAKLIEDTTKKREQKARRISEELRDRKVPDSWRRHLVNLSFRPETIKNVPLEILENEKFLKEVVKASLGCLHYLPDEVKERPSVTRLILQSNPDAFGLLAEKSRDDRKFVESLDIPITKIFPYLSERLRNDRDFVITHLPQNSEIFPHLSGELQDDDEIAKIAVFAHEYSASSYFRLCSDRIRDNRDFVTDVIQFCPNAYASASERLKEDADIAKLALEKNPALFRLVPSCLKNNKELVRIVAKHRPDCLDYAAESLSQDEELILELIDLNPDIVKECPVILGRYSLNKNIMMAAIAVSREAISYAHPELKNDPEFIRACAKSGVENAFRYMGDELSDNEEFVLEAVKVDSSNFQYASERVRGLRHIAETAVQKNPSMYRFVSKELQIDVDFARLALNAGGTYDFLYPIAASIKDNEQLVIEFMEKSGDPRYFMSAEPEVRSMKEVAKIAIHLDVKSLASLHINLMNDPDFIDFVVGKYGCQLAEKGYEIEHHTLWLRIGSHPDYSFQNIPDEYRNDYFFVRQLVDTRPELAEDADAKNVLEKHSYQNKFNKYKNQKESILPKILSENISKTPFYNESEEHHSKIFKEFSLSKKIVSAINISPIKQKLDLLNTQYKIG